MRRNMQLAVNETAYHAKIASAPAGRVLASFWLVCAPPDSTNARKLAESGSWSGGTRYCGLRPGKKERILCEVREALQGRILVTQTSDQCVQEQGSSLAAGTLSIESLDQRVADVMKHVGIVSEGPKPVLRVARERARAPLNCIARRRHTTHTIHQAQDVHTRAFSSCYAHAADIICKAAAGQLRLSATPWRSFPLCEHRRLPCTRW